MPVKDDIWVIDDENILTVDTGAARKPRPAAVPSPRRPSPMGEAAIPVAGRASSTGSKRPLVAATLSLFVCGAGQLFNGQRQLGALFLLVEAMVVTFHWSATAMWGFLVEMGTLFEVTEQTMLLAVAGLDTFFVGLVLINVAQAYRHAASSSGEFDGFGRPAVAALASLVVPGWGQLVNAQLGKALCFFFLLLTGGLAAASLVLAPFAQYFARINLIGVISQQTAQAVAGSVFLASALWVLSIYDAILVARYRGR